MLLAVLAAKLLNRWLSYDTGLLVPFIWLLYGTWFDSRQNRGTPGKFWTYLEVQNHNGSTLSISQAFLRNLVKLFSGALLGIGYLMALKDQQHRTLHDRAAGTVVAELGWGKIQNENQPQAMSRK